MIVVLFTRFPNCPIYTKGQIGDQEAHKFVASQNITFAMLASKNIKTDNIRHTLLNFIMENNEVKRMAKAGEEFSIVLQSKATAGYIWDVQPFFDKNILQLISSTTFPVSSKLGSNTTYTFTFKAVGEGPTLLKMQKLNIKEGRAVAEEKTYLITVVR